MLKVSIFPLNNSMAKPFRLLEPPTGPPWGYWSATGSPWGAPWPRAASRAPRGKSPRCGAGPSPFQLAKNSSRDNRLVFGSQKGFGFFWRSAIIFDDFKKWKDSNKKVRCDSWKAWTCLGGPLFQHLDQSYKPTFYPSKAATGPTS